MSDHKPLSPPGRFGPFSEPSRIVCVICGDLIGCEAPSLVGPSIPASADDWAKAVPRYCLHLEDIQRHRPAGDLESWCRGRISGEPGFGAVDQWRDQSRP